MGLFKAESLDERERRECMWVLSDLIPYVAFVLLLWTNICLQKVAFSTDRYHAGKKRERRDCCIALTARPDSLRRIRGSIHLRKQIGVSALKSFRLLSFSLSLCLTVCVCETVFGLQHHGRLKKAASV